ENPGSQLNIADQTQLIGQISGYGRKAHKENHLAKGISSFPPSPLPQRGMIKTPDFSGVFAFQSRLRHGLSRICPGPVPGTNRKRPATTRTSTRFSFVNPFE
ncbi:hypothetical protein, partial [Zavarzinella formosa]|uniref:hypothetical protein n=1 Tax=Zavarzinella formosa TaxID=360055 RepID=UPI001EE64AF8